VSSAFGSDIPLQQVPSASILISRGSFFEVYKIRIGLKWYVRKQLRPDLVSNDFYVHVLDREFAIAQALDHPNIVKYLYRAKDDLGDYLIMEYVDATPLSQTTKKKETLAKQIVNEIGSALVYLHDRGIVHGDLSADNILFNSQTGHWVLIDFGHASSAQYINTGGGTTTTVAPESRDSDKIGPQSDVYSLCKLILLLGGKDLSFFNKKILSKGIKALPHERYQDVKTLVQAYNNTSLKNTAVTFSFIFILATATYCAYIGAPSKEHHIETLKKNTLTVNPDSGLADRKVVISSTRKIEDKQPSVIQENTTSAKKGSILSALGYGDYYPEFRARYGSCNSKHELIDLKNTIILENWNKFQGYLKTIKSSEQRERLTSEYGKMYYLTGLKVDSLITAVIDEYAAKNP